MRATLALRRATELNPKHDAAQLKLAELMTATADKSILEDAKKRLDDLLEVSPDNSDALDALAIAELRLGNREDAVQHLEQAIRKAPRQLKSSVLLAHVRMAEGKPTDAEQILEEAIQHAPQSAEAALALAQFYLATRKVDRGLAEVRRALQIDAKSGIAMLTLAAVQVSQGQTEQADRTYRELSALPDKRYRPLHAMFLYQQGRPDAAATELQRLFTEDPKNRDIRTRLVALYLATNKPQEAKKFLSSALKENSKDTDALYQRSQLYLKAGLYTEAESDLQQVLHMRPDSANAHYALSRVHAAQGAMLSRRQELNEALRLDPNLLTARIELARVFIAAKEGKIALQVMDRTPEAQKNTLPAIIGRNWALLAAGDLSGTQKGIERGLAIAKAPDLLLQNATLRMMQKDYAAARSIVEEILQQNSGNVQAWSLLASTYAAEHQLPAAVRRLREAVAQNPKAALLQYLLANWLIATGNSADARSALAAAKAANPNFVAADLTLAQLDFSAGKLDTARQILSGLVSRNPKNVPARLLLGSVEERAVNRPAAIIQYQAVLAVSQNNAVALNNLAYLLARNNPDEALKFAQQAGELAPENPAVQDTLGWAYYRKGFYGLALNYLKSAVSKEGTPRRKYHLAMAYFKLGNSELGNQTLKAALAVDPDVANSDF